GGWVLVGGGVLTAAAFSLAFPRLMEPVARQTLAGYGYDPAAVDEEVGLLYRTALLAAGCVVSAGLILVAFCRVEGRLRAPGAVTDSPVAPSEYSPSPVAVGPLLACFLVTPIVVVALGSLTGVPFHQTRNFVVVLPAVCLAWGFALDRLVRTTPGIITAAILLCGVVAAVGQYHAIGRVVDHGGRRLGLDTIEWREVRHQLATRPIGSGPVVLVKRPPTDPGLYYLSEFAPERITPDALPAGPPKQLTYVHVVGNPHSEQLKRLLEETRGLTQFARGRGWELYTCP
ncbi:MAG TPA: hypothetical protein VM529_13020, partial [Gemmata sp.]|nr:hypothetical protein [Gemmata sp.]